MPRGKRIKAGDRVRCRYFNWPERKSYGPYWEGTVVAILTTGIPVSGLWYETETRDYMVRKDGTGTTVTLHRREIKKVLTERR